MIASAPEAKSTPAQDTESDRGFAIYVHWPFCASKCPYCDFNSHVRDWVDQAAWRRALVAELSRFAAETSHRPVRSIFFGGGTPSLMDPETVSTVIDAIAGRWPIEPDVEITLEANPSSVEAARFRGFRAAGVNRVSVGVQALDEADLKGLGRLHSVDDAVAALSVAASVFDRFSLDLIYGRPGQSLSAWRAELDRALSFRPDHIAVYQLTIEPGTVFHTLHRRGELILPDDTLQADLYDATRETLHAAGLPAYEVSNHARPGAECRHNLVYWRYGDYAGVGPGAHGRLTLDGRRTATRTHRAPEVWLERVQSHGHGEHERETVAPAESAREALMMGLRLAEGVPVSRIEARSDQPADRIIDQSAWSALTEAGFLAPVADRLVATDAGMRMLNAVIARLIL